MHFISLSRFDSVQKQHDSATEVRAIGQISSYALRKTISTFGALEVNSFAAAAQEERSLSSSLIK